MRLLFCLYLCLCLAAPSVWAEPSCRRGCTQSDNNVLQYAPGKVYEYNFDSIMTVGLNSDAATTGAERDDTNLKILGTAKLFAEGNCGYTLQLGAVRVTTTKDQPVEKKLMKTIQKPVHFSMVGGRLEPELCTDPADTEYALNVKRAIVSLFQTSTESDGQEIDVFGQCPTHTSSTDVAGTKVISKVRNLNNCAYREKIHTGIINGLVNERAGVRSSNLLRSDYAKESKVQNGIIENVHVTEEYKFMASANGGPDIRAKVVTTLKVKNPGGAAAQAPATGSASASVMFQQPEPYGAKNIGALKQALSDTVQSVNNYVQKNSASQFVDLIRLMRSADADTLLELSAVPQPMKVLGRKVYLDALFRTATPESAKAIIKQINKMSDMEKAFALLSLNLVQTVDRDLINQAASLLTPTAPKEAFLAVGGLVGKFCQQNSCENTDVVEVISKRFVDSLKRCRANTKKDEERIIYALKGIGNTEGLGASVSAALTECASPGRAIRIRVAALQAFDAKSCDASVQAKALELLRDRNEDSELRIEAYLALVECPTAQLANDLAEIVNSETVYQVGGFIASHLKAIRDSTDATREKQRHYLGNIRITKQFPRDVRRYSFNNELSYRFDALGSSASADYKLIYSQQGFLPRSARLNVTAEVFGTNFNVFEASMRQENLESVLEYYVGPKGLLNKGFDEIMRLIEVGGGEGPHRARRSIADDTAKVAKRYKTFGSKANQDVNLDMSLKLFGSELMFLSLGDNIPSSLDDIIKYFSTALDKVKNELTNFNKEFVMHTFFMDSSFVYPTGVGVPLELESQGFAANKLDIGLGVNVDAILEQNWQNAEYRFKVVPSIDVNVNMKMSFNAYVVETGLRCQSNMHSAAGSDIKLAFINDGNGFNADIELPREKLELIDLQVSTDFYVAEFDKPIRSIPLASSKKHKNDKSDLCFNQLEAVGINVCFSSNLPSIKNPAANDKNAIAIDDKFVFRPFSFNLYITAERKFNLRGTYNKQQESGAQQWKLDFSTPGSQVSHDTSLMFELGDRPKTYARLAFDNSQLHFALEAGINNDQQEVVLYAQYEEGNEIKKNRIGFVKNGNEYRPVIELQTRDGVSNDINGYRVDGRVIVQETGEKQARYTFENVQVSNRDNERVVVNGWADVAPTAFNSELSIAPGKYVYKVKTQLKLENGEYVAALFVNDEKTPDNVMGGSAQLQFTDDHVVVQLVGKGAQWELNSATDVAFVKSENGRELASSQISQEGSVKHKNKVVAALKLTSSTEGDNKFTMDVQATSGPKIAALVVKYNGNQRHEGDFIVEINGKLNKHFVDIVAKCDVNGNRFVLDEVLTTSWGTMITLKGELGQRYTAQDVHIDLQGVAQFSTKDKPTQWTLKVIGAPEKSNGEFRLSRDNVELIKLTTDCQHPQDKFTAGKANLNVKNVLIAKMETKIAKNGKGELTASFETQKTEPKHLLEVSSKFNVPSPKYDVEATVVLDGKKVVYVKTENVMDKQKFNTKNVVEMNEKKVSFDASGLVKGDWQMNGEIQGNFAFTCPEGRVIDGSLKRKVTTNQKTHIAQGNMEVKLNDQLPNGGKKRSVTATGKLEKLNVKAKEFSMATQLLYTDFDGKTVDLGYNMKHLPKGQNKMVEVTVNLKGDLLNLPIDMAVVVDEYSRNHAVYHINANYGSTLNGNVNGNFNLGDRGTPVKFDVEAKLDLPSSELKSVALKSNGNFLRPTTDRGLYVLNLHVDESTGNQQFIKFDTVWKLSTEQGVYNVALETNQMKGPFKAEGSYQRDQAGSSEEGTLSGKQKVSFDMTYADYYVKSNADLSFADIETADLHYTLDTNSENFKDVDFKLRAYKLDTENSAITADFKSKNKNMVLDSKFYRSTHKKGCDVHLTLPSGEKVVATSILEILGPRKARLTVELDNLLQMDLKGNAEAAYQNEDDFYIQAQWNSNRLKLNNYEMNVVAKGKGLTFSAKNAEGPIVNGNVGYTLKKEKNKIVIEGQGQLQYKGKSQNANFRLVRQVYEFNADKEVGFSYTLNGNLGPKNGVSTFKITDREFNVKLSMCEEKKQCVNLQAQSIVALNAGEQDSNAELAQHSLLMLADLRELGYPYEFELQSKTTRQGLRMQYSLDSSIISSNNIKYQLMASVVPHGSLLQLKLPNRELAFETKQRVPEPGQIFGHYEGSAAFYFDRLNNPNEVTRIVSSADITGVENVAINGRGEIKFEHPKIRPLSVSGKFDANRERQTVNGEVVFDIFRTPQMKIVATSMVKNNDVNQGHSFNITTSQVLRSEGFDFLYELNGHTAMNTERQEVSSGGSIMDKKHSLQASAFLFGSKDRIEVIVDGMDERVVQIMGEFNRQKYSSKFSTQLQMFGQKPVVLKSEVQPTFFKFNAKREGLVDASAELKLGKELKVNIEGSGRPLIQGRVALDTANFLQTTYKSNEEDVKVFLDNVEKEVREDTEKARAEIKNRFDKLRQMFDQKMQLVKDSAPDVSQMTAAYQTNLQNIMKELENDPALKQIADTYRHLYEQFNEIATKLTKMFTEFYDNVSKSVIEVYQKWEIAVRDTILPAWEQFTMSLVKAVGQVRIEVVNTVTKAVQMVMEQMKQYGPTLKNYSKAVGEALKPLNEALQEFIKASSQVVEELLNELKEYLSRIPTFEAIRIEVTEKLEKMQLIEKIIQFIEALLEQTNVLPVTIEMTEFVQAAHDYVVDKLRQKKIENEEQVLNNLLHLYTEAIRSVINYIGAQLPAGTVGSLSTTGFSSMLSSTAIPYTMDVFSRLPELLTFRISLVNYLLNENWKEIFSREHLESWIFFKDFELRGHLVDGKHVFTFDGQHYMYPGNCRYILAQDSVDNNFTVVAQLNAGKLKNVILTDRDGNFMEINDAGVLKLNGNNVEFPVHSAGMHAWRRYYTMWMLTEYGVEVMCTNDLKICHVNVNGFYTSKTRGLLGNGNAEPNDDYLQIDGTQATDYAAFANGYGMGKCAPVNFDENSADDKQTHSDICTELFESQLAVGYLTINPRPYRAACDQAVAAVNEKDKETTACTVASAYASALKLRNVFVLLPLRCLKCPGAAGQREVGQEFTVKIPTNKADLVFVVDMGVSRTQMTNLVAPVIREVRDTLKARGLTDVQIAVVAYNETQRYPALLTSDNGKLNYQGNLADVNLDGPKNLCEDCKSHLVVDPKLLEVYDILETLVNVVVPQSDEKAFALALQYPFRAGAAKSIIDVRGEALEYGNVLRYIRAQVAEAVTDFDSALLHLIAPVEELSLEGVPTEKLVGFNSRLVATLDGKDAKKRQKLQFENDMGIDFVLNNGGWVFATQNFDSLKAGEQKKFLNQVTNSIADTLFKTEIVSECLCMPVYGLHAQHACSIKSTNFVPNKKPKAA